MYYTSSYNFAQCFVLYHSQSPTIIYCYSKRNIISEIPELFTQLL